MADNKTNKTASGKSPAASPDVYEPAAFAAKYGMIVGEASTIIKRYGPSRKKLDAYMAARGA